MSNLGCIGLATTQDDFPALMEQLVERAVEDAPRGDGYSHLRWTDASGASAAFHCDPQSSLECMTPWFASPAPTRWRVRTVRACVDETCIHCSGADCDLIDGAGEMATRACIQWLHFLPWSRWLAAPQDFELDVVGFAQEAAWFADEKSFADDPSFEKLKIAPTSFFSHGMFGPAGDLQARAVSLLCGKVVAAEERCNQVTQQKFIHVRVETLPGAIDWSRRSTPDCRSSAESRA